MFSPYFGQTWCTQFNMQRLTQPERERIGSLRNEGLTQKEIADEIGCSQSTVSLIVGDTDGGLHFGHADKYECVKEHLRDGPVYIHRLLAAVDHSLDELKGNHVHHKNGVGWDNRPGNIEVLTPAEHGNHHRGEWEPTMPPRPVKQRTKLTPEDLDTIIELRQGGEYQTDIADEIGCDQGTVSRVLKYNTQ